MIFMLALPTELMAVFSSVTAYPNILSFGGLLRFERGTTAPKTVVLPLHHRPMKKKVRVRLVKPIIL